MPAHPVLEIVHADISFIGDGYREMHDRALNQEVTELQGTKTLALEDDLILLARLGSYPPQPVFMVASVRVDAMDEARAQAPVDLHCRTQHLTRQRRVAEPIRKLSTIRL